MAVKSGYLQPQEKEEFVRAWLSGDDPTELAIRGEKPVREPEEETDEQSQATKKE